MLTVTIAGVDRTALVRVRELQIQPALTSEPDACTFPLVSPDGSYEPAVGDEVIVTDESANRVFGGVLNSVRETAAGSARRYQCSCVDFTVELDRRLIVESYTDQAAGTIVQDWVAKVNEYQPAGKLFTTNNVQSGPTVKKLKTNYLPFSQLMEKMHRLTGYEWYVDYSRDVHFFPTEAKTAPIPLRPRSSWTQDGEWFDLEITRGPLSQIRSRVYVRGATYEGNQLTLRWTGDGKQRLWPLGYLARGVTVYKNGVQQTLGLDNISSGKQFYSNFQEKFVRQDDAEPVLTSADELQVTFTPLIPVRVVLQDEDLVSTYGIREHLVEDKSIDSKEVARLRGKLEIRDREVHGRFRSLVTGWRPGQTFDCSLTSRNLSGVKGLVTRTTFQYAGDLNRYVTTVDFGVI